MDRQMQRERLTGRARLASSAGLFLALTLAGCGASHHQSAGATSAASEASVHTATTATHGTPSAAATHSLSVALTTPPHEPEAGRLWPIIVHAHSSTGAPVSGTVSYAFLFGGAAVGRRPGGQMHGGIFHDNLEFPASALGYPLTLEVIVRAGGQRGSVLRPISVHQ
jgi:hypothetical protein